GDPRVVPSFPPRRCSDLRRAVRMLIENQWAMEFQRDGSRSPVIVPWMPPAVERMVVSELREVRGEVGRVGEWNLECILYLTVDRSDEHTSELQSRENLVC